MPVILNEVTVEIAPIPMLCLYCNKGLHMSMMFDLVVLPSALSTAMHTVVYDDAFSDSRVTHLQIRSTANKLGWCFMFRKLLSRITFCKPVGNPNTENKKT